MRALPTSLHRPLLWLATLVFFFAAAPARRAVLQHLAIILPGSSRVANYLRTFKVFANFGWSLADEAVHRLLNKSFRFEVEGEPYLQKLITGRGAIVLTAHMGNYNLGAALFAQKFQRQLRMIRAPEPDALSSEHMQSALRDSSAGGVEIGYSDEGTSLVFDLLAALRNEDIISVQGDRLAGQVARAPVMLFGQQVLLPSGPFFLAFSADTIIYPLFMVRTGNREYKVIASPPIVCSRTTTTRKEAISVAMQQWADVLEKAIRDHWPQWFAFTPVFGPDDSAMPSSRSSADRRVI